MDLMGSLTQVMIEGSADFVGELISGEHINQEAFSYGEEHEDRLCKEFVELMNGTDYTNWLYGTSGHDNRPRDLGYWMGYKITEAYFNKQQDKKEAIKHILTIDDPIQFVKSSGYLDSYFTKK